VKIAVVVLIALSLSGCYGLGMAGVILDALQGGGSNSPQAYVQQPRPASYSCYNDAYIGVVNCYPN
jgi:hypothetical protein